MQIAIWKYILSMFSYVTILIGIISIMRKHFKFSAFFWIASLFTIPLWLRGGVVGWFRWAKNFSVLVPTIFLGFVRLATVDERKGKAWSFIQKNWVRWFFYGILFLNILEATLKDFEAGNTFNAMCGFLLCVTIPFANRFWNFSKEKPGDLLVYTTVMWNFAYTTWNACFVYGESPKYFASSLCILIAAELYPILLKRPELYVISRVYTLATHLIVRSCFPLLFPSVMDSSSWFDSKLLVYWGLFNFTIIVPYVFWHMWQLQSGNCEVSFRRGRRDVTASSASPTL